MAIGIARTFAGIATARATMKAKIMRTTDFAIAREVTPT